MSVRDGDSQTKLNYLNLGCGYNPIKCTDEVSVFNVDMGVKDDDRIINFDITKFPYPYDDGFFDRIYLLHTIEHIPEQQHQALLAEFRRILNENGELVIAYPEFKCVAQNYIDNKDDNRDFWKATIYGRGRDEWDRHKALMDTAEFSQFVKLCGFQVVAAIPEKGQEFNTVCILAKGPFELTYEELMGREFAHDVGALT